MSAFADQIQAGLVPALLETHGESVTHRRFDQAGQPIDATITVLIERDERRQSRDTDGSTLEREVNMQVPLEINPAPTLSDQFVWDGRVYDLISIEEAGPGFQSYRCVRRSVQRRDQGWRQRRF